MGKVCSKVLIPMITIITIHVIAIDTHRHFTPRQRKILDAAARKLHMYANGGPEYQRAIMQYIYDPQYTIVSVEVNHGCQWVNVKPGNFQTGNTNQIHKIVSIHPETDIQTDELISIMQSAGYNTHHKLEQPSFERYFLLFKKSEFNLNGNHGQWKVELETILTEGYDGINFDYDGDFNRITMVGKINSNGNEATYGPYEVEEIDPNSKFRIVQNVIATAMQKGYKLNDLNYRNVFFSGFTIEYITHKGQIQETLKMDLLRRFRSKQDIKKITIEISAENGIFKVKSDEKAMEVAYTMPKRILNDGIGAPPSDKQLFSWASEVIGIFFTQEVDPPVFKELQGEETDGVKTVIFERNDG